MANKEEQTIESRYKQLDRKRQSMLNRARECAELTIPTLLPPEGSTEDTTLKTPYQGLGARGVNNLASKLLLTLLPPNNTFFRLNVNDIAMEQLQEQDENLKTEVEQKLSQIEQDVMERVRADALRVDVFEALKLLLVTGDALLYIPDDSSMEVFKVDHYVVQRNSMGDVLEIITKETIDLFSLPEEVQGQIIQKNNIDDVDEKEKRDEEFDLYTRIALSEDGDEWVVRQEVNEINIDSAEGTYDFDKNPWIPLRWSASSGDNYGRGLVEEHLGDFKTLESLTKALVEGTTIGSRILGLVNPSGVTRTRKLVEAENGAFIEGREEDVTFLQLDKQMDYKLAYETIAKIEQRLKRTFLLMDAIQRDAERVTAEEIRMMAKELEDSLGGAYSLLSLEFQQPLVKRLMDKMESKGELPELPEDIVEPQVVTGIEALGRGHDLEKLHQWLQSIAPLGEEIIAQYVNHSTFMKRAATALGIDTEGLLKSEEDVQRMNQQQQGAQTLQNMAPEIMKQIGQRRQQGQGEVESNNG